MEIRFPRLFEQFSRWVSMVANLDALKLFKFGCLVNTTFHARLLFSTLMPIIAAAMIGMVYISRDGMLARNGKLEEKSKLTDTCTTFFLAITYLVFGKCEATRLTERGGIVILTQLASVRSQPRFPLRFSRRSSVSDMAMIRRGTWSKINRSIATPTSIDFTRRTRSS